MLNYCDDCRQSTGGDCGKHNIQYYRQPYRCPVCDGRGFILAGFYVLPTINTEQCRSCGGEGVIWR